MLAKAKSRLLDAEFLVKYWENELKQAETRSRNENLRVAQRQLKIAKGDVKLLEAILLGAEQ